jgi:hypothetical protein
MAEIGRFTLVRDVEQREPLTGSTLPLLPPASDGFGPGRRPRPATKFRAGSRSCAEAKPSFSGTGSNPSTAAQEGPACRPAARTGPDAAALGSGQASMLKLMAAP